VLTTHNMLECEAVCTRIGIMKLGQLVCLGDSQHLRSVHGTGFLLEMSLQNTDAIEEAKSFVNATFPGAVIVDEHATLLNFEIPTVSIQRLSIAFATLEQAKQSLQIVDYALSQSTLEQVFLKQIRPTNTDAQEAADAAAVASSKKPTGCDYAMAYFMWLCAIVIPGLHHFYLGNFWRGMKYLFTFNEVYAGWLLDLFEIHVLVQKSVEQYGHTRGCFACCCGSACCRSCSKAPAATRNAHNDSTSNASVGGVGRETTRKTKPAAAESSSSSANRDRARVPTSDGVEHL
jgi:TM2 domain-containing membrane protein YozV